MEPLSEGKRVLYVFTKPLRAMEDIGGRPGFAVPITLMVVAPLLPIILNIGYYQNQIVMALTVSMQQTGISLDIPSLVQTQLYITMGTLPVITLLTWLVFTVAVLVLSHLFEGDGEVTFKTVASITGYAYLVKALLNIITGLNILLLPDSILTFSLYDVAQPLLQLDNRFILYFLQALSIFRIWEYSLVGVGIYAVKRVKKANAAAIMVIVFLLHYGVACLQLLLQPGI